MSDFAEQNKEEAQALIESILYAKDDEGQGRTEEDLAKPEIDGDMTFDSVMGDLQATFGGKDASGSGLFMNAYGKLMVVATAYKGDKNNWFNTESIKSVEVNMRSCENTIRAIDEYISQRGRKKVFWKVGALTENGKKRYNAMCKARVLVEQLHTALEAYSVNNIERQENRGKEKLRDGGFFITGFGDAYANVFFDKKYDELQSMLVGGEYDFDKIFEFIKKCAVDEEVSTEEGLTDFIKTLTEIHVDALRYLIAHIDSDVQVRQVAKMTLMATTEAHRTVLKNIMYIMVDFKGQLLRMFGGMSLPQKQFREFILDIKKLANTYSAMTGNKLIDYDYIGMVNKQLGRG